MATFNMVTITSSPVKSLQNCSRNHQHNGGNTCDGNEDMVHDAEVGDAKNLNVELNSQGVLPRKREPYPNLQTGEIGDVKMRAGMKLKDGPHIKVEDNGYYNLKDDIMSHNSASERSSANNKDIKNCEVLVVVACRVCYRYSMVPKYHKCCYECGGELARFDSSKNCEVLVAVGCRVCYNYSMVPKYHKCCSKCGSELIHFDSPKNGGH